MSKQLILKISKGILPLLIFFESFGQTNLVPNPSFEIYTVCPKIAGTLSPAPNFWSTLPIHNGLFYNSCANITAPPFGVPYNNYGGNDNYQNAHLGNGYLALVFLNTSPLAGNYGGKRHYSETQLTDSLKAGKRYFCGFYVALSDGANYGTNNAAMCITKTALNVDTATTPNWVINQNPQIYNYGNPIIKDTQNWTKISTIFKAQGGEKFITIGNFKDNANTSFDRYLPAGTYDWAVYGLDDVFVYELNSIYNLQADAGRDTTITTGDSAFIGTLTNGIDSIKWQVLGGNAIDSIRPGFWVHPTVNTCYVVTQTVNGFTSSDTVCVTVQPLPLKFLKYELRFTNGEQVENRWQTANEINVSHFYVQRSTNGRDFNIIHKEPAKNQALNNYAFIDEAPNEGVNYYRIVSVDKDGKTSFSEVKQININHSSLNTIVLFPNPTTRLVNIVLPTSTVSEAANWYITVTDVYGKTIIEKQLTATQSQLNIQGGKGLYSARLFNKGSGKQINTKIVLQ